MSQRKHAPDLTCADGPEWRPHEEYLRRLEAARAALVAHDRAAARLANMRLLAFLAILAVAWVALFSKLISPWWIVAPLFMFLLIVRRFDRAELARSRADRVVAHYQDGIAKLEDRWSGRGNPGTHLSPEEHLYADDLDLFGGGSLFERIAVVRTHEGESTLASWLLRPAPTEEVLARQEAVAELRSALDLREELAVLGRDVGTGVLFQGLATWGAEPRQLSSNVVRVFAFVLSVVALPALACWLVLGWSPLPFLAIAACEGLLFLVYRRAIHRVLAHVSHRGEELTLLKDMLQRLETATVRAPKLVSVLADLGVGGRRASTEIQTLGALISTLDARRNMLLGPISPFLLWGTQIAFAIEAWRSRSGGAIGGWLDAIGQFEALASLAAFAYENPDAVFPELAVESPPELRAIGLAHPLLPAGEVVRNDVSLGGVGHPRVLMVSGSNMSGKSTLLRSLGVAVVLALAGSVVRARHLRLSPFAVGATLRIQDSLQAGKSRFFAEIVRLRRIVELAAGPRPLLFLLDEILAGTNSHDRRIGADAIIAGLVEKGAVGLVTTHDLALAEIADRFNGRIVNVHFGDTLKDGKLLFDFQIKPGVVRHSNALELMRSIGLGV